MSRKSLTPLNTVSSASDPTTPTPQTGDIYYNTSTSKLRVYTGSAWADVSGGSSAEADDGLTDSLMLMGA